MIYQELQLTTCVTPCEGGGPHDDYELRVLGRVRSIPVQCDMNPGQLPYPRWTLGG